MNLLAHVSAVSSNVASQNGLGYTIFFFGLLIAAMAVGIVAGGKEDK